MAYIQDDDIQSNGQGSAQPGQGSAPSSTTSTDVSQGLSTGGASSSDVGTGVSTAGVGAGGQGGWTNIQAYLNANKGNTSTADTLGKTVGTQFDADQKRITDDAESKKTDAMTAAQGPSNVDFSRQGGKADYAPTPTDDYVGDDGNTYNPFHPGGKNKPYDPAAISPGGNVDFSAYQPSVNAASGYLNSQYNGGAKAAYSPESGVQEIGNQLGDDSQFGALLNKTYSNAAGGQISSGQAALQKQLDQDSPELASQRTALQARYKALQDLAGGKAKEVNDAQSAGAQTFAGNQSKMKTDLQNQISSIEEGGVTNDEAPQYAAIRRALGIA